MIVKYSVDSYLHELWKNGNLVIYDDYLKVKSKIKFVWKPQTQITYSILTFLRKVLEKYSKNR